VELESQTLQIILNFMQIFRYLQLSRIRYFWDCSTPAISSSSPMVYQYFYSQEILGILTSGILSLGIHASVICCQ